MPRREGDDLSGLDDGAEVNWSGLRAYRLRHRARSVEDEEGRETAVRHYEPVLLDHGYVDRLSGGVDGK